MFSCGNQLKEVKSLETRIDSASYALGLDMAIKVKANFKDADRDLFLQGYKNGIDSTNILINPKDLNGFLRVFFQEQQAKKMEEQQANFHRLDDDGTKKAWTHPHIEDLRNNYEKIKNVLTRDVSKTEATDRPIFTTNEKHVGTDDKKEPAMMTKLCTTIHAMVNKKDEDEDLL